MTDPVSGASGENAAAPSRRPSPRDLVGPSLFVLIGLLNLIDPARNSWLRLVLGTAATVYGVVGVVSYLRNYWRWRKDGFFLSEDERPKPSLW